MDPLHFLGTPLGAAAVGIFTAILGELFGNWLSSRSSDTALPSVTVQGDARVRDITVGHRWQTEIHHHHAAPQAATQPAAPSDDEHAVIFVVFIATALAACVASLVMAKYWHIFEVVVQALVMAALFTTAALWRHWPPGLSARLGMRVLIVVVASLLMWAVAVIPDSVDGIRDLAFLNRHTRGLEFAAAVAKVPGLLGPQGLFVYSLRLIGLIGLIAILALLCTTAVGAALIARDLARGKQGWGSRLGAHLAGNGHFDWGKAAFYTVFAAFCTCLVHPFTLAWLARTMNALG